MTLTSAAGCDSIATLNVTVNPVVTSSADTTVCISALPFTWNGQTVNAAGPYTVTLTSAAGCDSIATLNLTDKCNNHINDRCDGLFNQLPYNGNGTDYNAAGIYQFTTTNATGCNRLLHLIYQSIQQHLNS